VRHCPDPVGARNDLSTAIMNQCTTLLQRVHGEICPVLLYHSVADGASNPYLDSSTFRAQMEMLSSEFRVIHADEYLWHLERSQPAPPRSVLVTFDDGLANNYEVVHPIMDRLQLPWILFATTKGLEGDGAFLWMSMLRAICRFTCAEAISLLGRTWTPAGRSRRQIYKEMNAWLSQHEHERAREAVCNIISALGEDVPDAYVRQFCVVLNTDQLRQLSRSPLVELGAHTQNHPFLPRIRHDQLSIEVDTVRHRLEEVAGRTVRMFAYPSGQYGHREIEQVKHAGFECAFAVVPQVGCVPRYEIARVGVYSPSVSRARLKAMGLASAMRAFGFQSG
jgi:peptidoglycan/xylan/chitin deacetylase (PgdA/CDA1 family)